MKRRKLEFCLHFDKALGGKKEELALLECTLAKKNERWKEYHFKVILNQAASTSSLIITLYFLFV